jgi:hypothetical protein
MPENVALFYADVFKAINNIKANYIINKNFNYTHIPMLAFLSRTKSNQIGTYYDEAVENFYSNKSEFIELEKSLSNITDIIIFTPSIFPFTSFNLVFIVIGLLQISSTFTITTRLYT